MLSCIENDLDQQIIGPTECFTLEDFTSYIKKKMRGGGDILYLDKKGDRMVVWFIAAYQSVHITTIIVSSNPAQAMCTRYNIMWWSLTVTCDRSVVFSMCSPFSTKKTDLHDKTEILLKVTLNTTKPIKSMNTDICHKHAVLSHSI